VFQALFQRRLCFLAINGIIGGYFELGTVEA